MDSIKDWALSITFFCNKGRESVGQLQAVVSVRISKGAVPQLAGIFSQAYEGIPKRRLQCPAQDRTGPKPSE